MRKTPRGFFVLVYLLVLLIPFVFISFVGADDGTYDAYVTTSSGTYTVPVEVEDGEVVGVQWPNGGTMSLDGAELSDGQAEGTNSKGDWVSVEIDDSSYEEEAEE